MQKFVILGYYHTCFIELHKSMNWIFDLIKRLDRSAKNKGNIRHMHIRFLETQRDMQSFFMFHLSPFCRFVKLVLVISAEQS